MKKEYSNRIISNFQNRVGLQDLNYIEDCCKKLPNSYYDKVMRISLKDPIITLLLSIFIGGLGFDRFYIGDTTFGVLKLCLRIFFIFIYSYAFLKGISIFAIFFFIPYELWCFIDIFISYARTKSKNLDKFIFIVKEYKATINNKQEEN